MMKNKPKQSRSKATLDAILTGSAQVLEKHGYGHITTDKIAERAGVSVGSIYQYFSNKDEVLRQLFARETNRHLGEYRSFQVDLGQSFYENLVAFTMIGEKDRSTSPELFREFERVPGLETAMVLYKDEILEKLKSLLRVFRTDLSATKLHDTARLYILTAEGIAHNASSEELDAGLFNEFILMTTRYLIIDDATDPADSIARQ
jgi:AcrR family transcriptional regulator